MGSTDPTSIRSWTSWWLCCVIKHGGWESNTSAPNSTSSSATIKNNSNKLVNWRISRRNRKGQSPSNLTLFASTGGSGRKTKGGKRRNNRKGDCWPRKSWTTSSWGWPRRKPNCPTLGTWTKPRSSSKTGKSATPTTPMPRWWESERRRAKTRMSCSEGFVLWATQEGASCSGG